MIKEQCALPILIGVLLLSRSLFSTTPVYAQASMISVSPSSIQIDLQKDAPEAIITYKNTTNNAVELSLSATDFNELESGYKPSFLTVKKAEQYKYKLSPWISFDKTNFIMQPKTAQQIKVFIKKDSLSPGGHYTAIMARITNQTETKEIAIQGILSSFLFVRTNTGKEKEAGNIDHFEVKNNFITFPKIASFTFHNTGDTTITPHGLVRITDVFGHSLAQNIINEDSFICLPDSTRPYTMPITAHEFLFPSIYTATLTGHFGKIDKQVTAQTRFFSIGSMPLLSIFALMILLITPFIFMRIKRRK
jgi:hypothetical protein